MRVIDGQQLLSTLAHQPLRSEQLFRRCFIGDQWIARDIRELIDAFGFTLVEAADQATAFSRIALAGLCENLTGLATGQNEHSMRSPSALPQCMFDIGPLSLYASGEG